MKDIWRELQTPDDGETAPLRSKPPGAHQMKNSSVLGAAALGTKGVDYTDPEETDLYETGFVVREIGPQVVRLWVGLQIAALFFQLLLWNEMATHLAEFEDVVANECAPERRQHGVCAGPMWSLTAWADQPLASSGNFMHPDRLSYQFSTKSSPPSFLLNVDPKKLPTAAAPLAADAAAATADAAPMDTNFLGANNVVADPLAGQDAAGARWGIEIVREDPPQAGPPLRAFHMGQHAMTFEDMSSEAKETLAIKGEVKWRATISMHGRSKHGFRFVSFVEDAASSHLQDLHANPQCRFGQSWKAFNEQHQGSSHQSLTRARSWLFRFLFIGAFMVYTVHKSLPAGGGGVGFKFHLVVLAKCLFQDLPQQIFIVMYLLGWFEAAGLRCQLCLFHSEHCGTENAFHFTNTMAILLTLVSSISNQLLVRPAFKRKYTEDDICLQCSMRTSAMCISILPFTTGICFASQSLLPAANFLHVLAAIPCGLGWLAFVAALLVPCLVFCDENCDDF